MQIVNLLRYIHIYIYTYTSPSPPRVSLLRDVSRRPACPPAQAPRSIYLHRDAPFPQGRLNPNPTNSNINQGLKSDLGRPRRELQVLRVFRYVSLGSSSRFLFFVLGSSLCIKPYVQWPRLAIAMDVTPRYASIVAIRHCHVYGQWPKMYPNQMCFASLSVRLCLFPTR
jgi:hypothetical protein